MLSELQLCVVLCNITISFSKPRAVYVKSPKRKEENIGLLKEKETSEKPILMC